VAVKFSGDTSGEPVKGQKVEEHVVTDLDLRNNENRPRLTSSAVAVERQGELSRNTIDKMADAITGSNDIGFCRDKRAHGPSGQTIYRKKYENIG